LIALIGAGTILLGIKYDFGNLLRMGPGFFPVLLGGALLMIGIGIGSVAYITSPAASKPVSTKDQHLHIDIRGWGCIILSVLSFIILAEYVGLIICSFISVFIACCGDKTAKLRTSLLFAFFMTCISTVLFSFVLKLPLPLLRLFNAEF
jgi:hypothetical protein